MINLMSRKKFIYTAQISFWIYKEWRLICVVLGENPHLLRIYDAFWGIAVLACCREMASPPDDVLRAVNDLDAE